MADVSDDTPVQADPAPAKITAKLEDISEDLQRLNCLIYDDLTVFDIRSLEQYNPIRYGDYKFSFCRRTILGDKRTFAYKDEVAFTGPSGKPHDVETEEQETEQDKLTHLSFELKDGDVCTADPSKKFKVSYEIFCDPTFNDRPFLDVTNEDPCNIKVSFTHFSGCPAFQATSIVSWLSENPEVLAAILIIFGAVVTFFGAKFFPWVLAIVGGGVTFFVVLLLASVTGALKALDKGNKNPTSGQVAATIFAFLAAILLALFVGWFIKKAQRLGITLLGAAAGFFGGFLLYTFVFIQWLENVGVLVTLSFLGAIIVGYLSWKYQKVLIVYLSAFFGAYAFVRGISLFAGNFPNEIALYGQLSSGSFAGLG